MTSDVEAARAPGFISGGHPPSKQRWLLLSVPLGSLLAHPLARCKHMAHGEVGQSMDFVSFLLLLAVPGWCWILGFSWVFAAGFRG